MNLFNKIWPKKKLIHYSILLIPMMLAAFNVFPQKNIEGVWKSDDGTYMMKVATFGEEYQGRIVWMKDEKDSQGNPKLDVKNPDEKMQKLPVKGSKILKDLMYNASKGNWTGGTIYFPETGKQYNCQVDIKGEKLTISFADESGANKSWTWTKNG